MIDVNDAAGMTAEEVRQAREALRLSQDHLAAELGVVPDVVAGFEAGTLRVPPRVAAVLRWRVAIEERERALDAAGHGLCAETVALIARFNAPGADRAAIMRAFETHTADCPQCRAREAYAQSLPPLPPAPSSTAGRAFGAFVRLTERLPRWARPIAWALTVVGSIALLRALLRLAGV